MGRLSSGAVALLVLLLVMGRGAPAQATDPADPFAHLRPHVGKTWKGEGKDGAVDVSRWDWALGGKAVRMTHALADGSYGGETIVFWDKPRQTLIYHYFTTAGFHTQGTITTSPTGMVAEEAVEGHPSITRVRSTGTFNPDGTLTSRADYLDGGKWRPGHGFTYREAPPGTVVPLPAAP